MIRAAARLRALLEQPGLLVAPGCYDGLSARLVERAGHRLGYVTGFGTAASAFGLPDTGLVSFGEMVDRARALAAAVSIPLVADADTGYGSAANVRRTVRAYARAGLAAIQVEDQVWPKRCGHTEGKEVVGLAEAVARIEAAADAREEEDIVVVARTDALQTHGFDAALERVRAFVEAGADVVFVEAPESAEELALIAEFVDAPLMVNLLEGGKTPLLGAAELEAMGYRIAIYPLTLLYAAARAIRDHLTCRDDENPFLPWQGPLSFEELREIVGFDDHRHPALDA